MSAPQSHLEAAARRHGFGSGAELIAHNAATREAAKAARIAKRAPRMDVPGWIRRFDEVRAELQAKGAL